MENTTQKKILEELQILQTINFAELKQSFDESLGVVLTKLLELADFRQYTTAIKQKSTYTFYSWLDEWLRTYKSHLGAGLEELEVAIRIHIKPNLPDVPLEDISSPMLQHFLVKIKKKPRTRESVLGVLRGSFNIATALGLVAKNPMLSIKVAKHKRKKGKALTISERLEFLQNIRGNKLEKAFLYYMYTGSRRSEALRLNVADVDFKNKLLYIRGTKTEESDRVIPLFEKVEKLLRSITPSEKGYYFTHRADTATHSFKKLCPKHKLHDLRHTFATMCLEAGVPLKVIQQWLGHTDIGTTANIYIYVTREQNAIESKKVNKYLRRSTLNVEITQQNDLKVVVA